MTKERRAFNSYPDNLRTRQNNQETFIADDPSFEPEQANFLNGFIGNFSSLTAVDLERTPPILEGTAERQKYQLAIGSTFINPDTQERESVASYTDLVNQIDTNGGEVSDPNRVFSVDYYAWTPPLNYDKHINFSRYLWIGTGTADVQGEYVTKEQSHSKTVIHVWDGVTLTPHAALINNGLPAPTAAGTFLEDASSNQRLVYRSDGATWQLLNLEVVSDVPTDFSEVVAPAYFYVARTGPDYQRPIVWKYSGGAGRWIPLPVVISSSLPESTRTGMIWEDSRLGGERVFKYFFNGTFQTLSYTSADGPPGTAGTDGEYLYDTREYGTLTDDWTTRNWWRHQEDLSPVDRAATDNEDQAVRPILEFWDGIEPVAGDTRDYRNDSPVFKKYAVDQSSLEGFDTGEETTIFEYLRSVTTQDDPVLGFPLSFNNTGEFLFEVTLESDTSTAIGYHYFLDTNTGLLHGIWHKSDELTQQAGDANGLYDIPVGLSSNPNHEILTTASRSRMLGHMTGVIGAQDDFEGSLTGQNSYRWTDRNPSRGATIIDAEETLLRTLSTLQDTRLDFPDAIRRMAKEYNKVLFRFTNKMNQLWDDLSFTNGNGSLYAGLTASEACDAVLTSIFVGRTEDFPFYNSEMGTFLETLLASGSTTVVDPNPRPIYIPPSPPRVGASPLYEPRSYEQRNGQTVLLGHEGTIIPSFSDERDLIWLEFQTRFFGATPDTFKVENSTFSARFNNAGIILSDFYGNYAPSTSLEPVDDVVEDFNAIVGPAEGLRVFSTNTAIFAIFNAGQWLTRLAIVDDIFLNNGDGEYYIFNGLGTFLIDRWNRPFAFEYTTNEFRQIIRRDFERFIIFRENDFSENTTFDDTDPFTWNFRSAGVEGHYVGIYSRVYNSFRPHSAAWELMGYSVEPEWWRTSYVPDSTAPDGTPRYGSAHPIWTDFAAGIVNHPSGAIQNDQFIMAGPVPVDAVGELLDPIAAGVVDNAKLDQHRIDDIWIFGDGSPMEQEFLNSSYFSFSTALAGYLMKNGQWTDSLWVSNRVPIGAIGTYPIFNGPHIVNGDTLTRPDISSRPIHLEVINGVTQVNLGVHAWISETINVGGGSPTVDFARVVKNTSPALMWKCAGYINEARTIVSTLSRAEIPFSDVHVILHKSQPISQNFASGVLVAREATGGGYRVFGFDPFDPYFTIDRSAVPTSGGQLLLDEEFTVVFTDGGDYNVTGGSVFPNKSLQHTFEVTEFRLPSKTTAQDTARLAVLVNGARMKNQHITVDTKNNTVSIEDIVELMEGDIVNVQVLTTQSSTSTQVRQFVVNNVTFPYFATGTGEYEQIEYGRYFETATEVINFMLSYGRFLVAQGWVFDTLSEGGDTRDWMLGAKRFARWVLEVESVWNPNPQVDILDEDTFYYSPIQDEVEFVSPYGQTTSVETIMHGAYGILNRNAEPIKTDGTRVSRIDDRLEITRTDVADDQTEMFGVRINLIEAEHVVVFSNTTRFNDVIYDPISGLSQKTLVIDSYRTLNWQGRLEANGYILSGGSILPNFEKQAFDFTRFYDRFNTIDDPTKRELARDLYGYVPANQSRSVTNSVNSTPSIERRVSSDSSQYMIPVGAADRTRFDYYRGMAQTKGTNRAIYAFTRGSTIGRDNFFINEDWAWKVGPAEFGDTRREVTRIDVNRSDFRDQVQVMNFGDPLEARNNTIEVPDFDRTDPTNNPRWILPPSECETEDSCNVEFPMSREKTTAPTPEITEIDFAPEPEPVTGASLSINTTGDFFDIDSTTTGYRMWFAVDGSEITTVEMPMDASSFATDTVSGGGTISGNVWRLSDPSADHHVWYSVEDSELSTANFVGVNGNFFSLTGPGDFFTLGVVDNGSAGFYHVWFDFADANTDPDPVGSLGGIRVGVDAIGSTDSQIARLVATALREFQDGAVFLTNVPEPGNEIVEIINVVAGAVDDIATSVPPTTPSSSIIVGQDETDYDNVSDNGTFVGGDGVGGTAYSSFDLIQLSDGSVITVETVDGNGDVLTFTVTTTGSTTVVEGVALTQTGTTGTGVGFTLTPESNNTVGLAFATFAQGTGPNADPGTTANGHKVIVSASDSDVDIAAATATTLTATPIIAGQDETNYNGATNNGTFVGGDGAGGTAYAPSDAITLSDGSLITVDTVNFKGDVATYTVTTSGGNNTAGVPLTQVSVLPANEQVGFTLTPETNNIFDEFIAFQLDADPEIPASFARVLVINTEFGDSADAVDVNAGVTITIDRDGSILTAAPASGGRTLIQITVLASATSQQISDAVVSALELADADFTMNGATNGNGTLPVVTVILPYPAQTNVAIGTFPTPPVVTVISGVAGIPVPDVENYQFYAKLYDVENNISILNHVQYDPQLEKFDTGATCLLDYTVENDPARYNAGPDSAFSNDRCWRDFQVGSLWWNPTRKLYIPYRDLLPEYENAAKFWGELLYYKTTIERPDDDDRTVITTYNYLDIKRTAPVPHGVDIGETITATIRKCDQSEYNLTNVDVIATSTTELEFEIETSPDTPATGDPEVVFGHIDIYEWVESPVLPSEWGEYVEGLNDPNHPNGIPLNLDDPSFVEITTRSTNNVQTTLYYFWVLNSTGENPRGKNLTASQVSSRIGDPIANQVPWFAPVDANNMIIFTDGEKVQDSYGLEILIDQRFLQTHGAFVLFSQGSRFFSVPAEIVEKMGDCLAQIDGKGNAVPSPLLADSEKYGSCFFPIQTVFADVGLAVDVYVSSINRIFVRKNLSAVDILTGIFKLEDELTDINPDGFWQRAAYIERSVEGDDVYESVQTIAERTRRFDLDLYAEGDIIRVIESGETDPWTGLEVPANYQLTDGAFIQVGIDNNTVTINSNIVADPIRFRGSAGQIAGALYFLIYEVLEKAEQNDLIYSLMHEMKVQHPDPRCDWFFKTSYITTEVSTSTDNSPFVRPDEVSAIRDNILNVKPFRTKFRGDVNTVASAQIEPVETNILEFPDKKISLILDRLSCNALDDCGWDTASWDTRQLPCSVWDKPLWDFDDLGRDEYYLLATIVGDSATSKFVIDAIFDPTLYTVRTVVKQNGVEVDADYIIITKSHTQLFVNTTYALATTFTVEIYQSQGFYADADPTFIGTTLDESLFLPTPSDYKHAIARTSVPPTEFRTVVGGDGNTFATTAGPWIEFYLNGTLLEPQVDYVYDFDYAAFTFTAILTVAPTPGDEIAFGFIRGCYDVNDPLGGRPEERIIAEVTDSVNICVINDYTAAYAGWDTTPWDVAAWDNGPVNVGRRVFIMSIGAQEFIPPGTEFFNTSEDIIVVDPAVIMGTSPMSYEIVSIELQKGGFGVFVPMTEGVEYGFIGTFNNAIATLAPDQQDFTANGVDFVFTTTAGTEIGYVFLNGALKTEGVEYTLDGTRTIITWIQPAPVISPNNATVIGTDEIGDSFATDFETGHLDNSLNADNMFVFQNRNLVPPTDYSVVAGVADLRFDTAPALGDELIFYTVGNNVADNSLAFARDEFTAGAAQTVFNTTSGGFATSNSTWVFVDGRYQVGGTDYTVTGVDQVTFLAPMAGGEEVETRIINKGVTDVEHIVFTSTATNGSPTDVIPGLNDADNIARVLIFVGDEIQNGWQMPPYNPDYAITNTNPDTINWNVRQESTELDWSGTTGAGLPAGAVPAAWFDLSAVTGTYRFWFSDGSTTAPVAGGTTLVPVPFTGAETDQDIADLVVAAILAADAEFANAHNGGGASKLVEILLVTGGAVPDAVDGAVPTGVGIVIVVNGNDAPTGSDISVRVIRTIQMSTTLVIDVNPNPGETVSAQFIPYIEPADVVRYTFNGWHVGPLGGYTVDDPMIAPLGIAPYGYDIVGGILRFDTVPPPNDFFSITYNVARPNGLPESILVRMENIVADILPDHESYDPPNGFDTFKPVGMQIINTTTNMTYTWDGTVWNTDPVPLVGAQYYVTRHQQIWEYDGFGFNLLFNVGDPFTKPPVVGYPAFGAGIRYGTYAYGTSTDALAQWPDAFYIMQHPGDCPV